MHVNIINTFLKKSMHNIGKFSLEYGSNEIKLVMALV